VGYPLAGVGHCFGELFGELVEFGACGAAGVACAV